MYFSLAMFAPSLALSWSFLYLLFFRLVTWFGLPAPTPFTNAVQLLLTLKMVSLANEVQAFHLAKKQEVSSFSKSPVIGHISKVPSLYDVLCYSYCYIGIMTGPFYRYQTYEDWLCQRTPGSIPALTPCVQRLRWVPLYAALFLGVSTIFPLAHVRSEDFLQHHFLYRAAWTMFISAYWHGLHVGYYLSFLTIPLCLAAETSMERGVRSRLSPAGQYWFDWVHWFLKMRAYDYMCMGFVLLSWGDTLRYWGSVYYCIQGVALLCI
ncbi:UNVERIFIED_CONTAM: hypothetical protein FKN15_016894 [Acipenser sinensis]